MTLPSPDATRRRRVQLGTTPELVPPDKYVPRYVEQGDGRVVWRPHGWTDAPLGGRLDEEVGE